MVMKRASKHNLDSTGVVDEWWMWNAENMEKVRKAAEEMHADDYRRVMCA